MRPVSKIFSDIIKSAGAGGIQFLITLVTTPIMTRLYAPEAYAAFSILYSMATLTINVGMLSLQHAYLTEKDAVLRHEIIQTMFLLLGGWVSLAILGAIGMAMMHAFHAGLVAFVLFPLLVLAYGMRYMLLSVAIARAHFSSTAFGQILEPLCSRGGSVVLGALFGGYPAFIFVAVIFGQLAVVWTIARKVVGSAIGDWRGFKWQPTAPLSVLRRYADFMVYNTCSQQAFSLVMLAVQMAIAAFFSSHVAGQYILALSIVMLPTSLVALTTAPVVYRHFIDVEQMVPALLVRSLVRAVALYLFAGLLILSPIFLFGEALFTIVFGAVWSEAGTIAHSLSVAYIGAFALIGVQAIFSVTRRLKLQFMLEIFSSILMVVVVCFGLLSLDFKTTIFYLSFALCFRNVLLLVGCFVAAFGHARSPLRRLDASS